MVQNKRKKGQVGTPPSALFTEILNVIQEKYRLSNKDLAATVQEILATRAEQESFPIAIITKKLTVLESVLKYLREEKHYSLHKIAELLGRNEKNLWHAYQSAKRKMPAHLKADPSSTIVPLEIFSNERFSPLEAVVAYLKEEKNLSFHEIALLLSRDDRTIWTTYMRAKKKHAKH